MNEPIPSLGVMRADAECVKRDSCGWLSAGGRMADYVLALVAEVERLRAASVEPAASEPAPAAAEVPIGKPVRNPDACTYCNGYSAVGDDACPECGGEGTREAQIRNCRNSKGRCFCGVHISQVME